MITIPNNDLQQKYYDNLAILWEAIFLEIIDNRLSSFIAPEDFEIRVNMVREHELAETFYEMLQVFGEDDFYTFVLPAVKELQDVCPSGRDYEEHFVACFNKLIKE